jgi:hypothetical protein
MALYSRNLTKAEQWALLPKETQERVKQDKEMLNALKLLNETFTIAGLEITYVDNAGIL